jgi:hypothetical protein
MKTPLYIYVIAFHESQYIGHPRSKGMDKQLSPAIKRGFLITQSQKLNNDYYRYCQVHAKACLRVRVYRDKCSVWLNMYPSDFDIDASGQQKADALFDWYFACAWPKIKPRQRICFTAGSTDIFISGIPAEDGPSLAGELRKICQTHSESRFEKWMNV